MKKLFSLFLVAAITLSLSACDNSFLNFFSSQKERADSKPTDYLPRKIEKP